MAEAVAIWTAQMVTKLRELAGRAARGRAMSKRKKGKK
jgi:hypothetical protein